MRGSRSHPEEYLGPNRTIAHRGSEVFVVVGKQIRWADLPSLKDEWQAVEETPSKKPAAKGKGFMLGTHSVEAPENEDGSYRVCR